MHVKPRHAIRTETPPDTFAAGWNFACGTAEAPANVTDEWRLGYAECCRLEGYAFPFNADWQHEWTNLRALDEAA